MAFDFQKDYLGGIEYADNNIEAIYHTEGILIPNGSGDYTFEYTLKDHLGNSGVTFPLLAPTWTIMIETTICSVTAYPARAYMHD